MSDTLIIIIALVAIAQVIYWTIACVNLASRKGYDTTAAGYLGFFMGLFGFLYYWAMPANEPRRSEKNGKNELPQGEEMASRIGLELQTAPASGAFVAAVVPESPAAVAGFQAGDLLVTLAGRELTARSREQLAALKEFISILPGDVDFTASVRRGDELLRLAVRPRGPSSNPQAVRFDTQSQQWKAWISGKWERIEH